MSKSWKLVILKEDKTYNYILYLVACALYEHENEVNRVQKNCDTDRMHPTQIAPNIGIVPATESKKLKSDHITRF